MAATRPFLLERYFGRYEHSVAHQLSASDCEPLTVGGLLALAGADPDELLRLRLGYTETRGAAALRAAIAAFYPGCRSDDVLVAGAPQEAILLLLQAVLAAGDEVVVLTPCYQSLKDLPARSGATVLEWRLQPTATGFALDWPALAALLQRQPRLLITNFPHNPTGLLPTLDEWLHLQRLVARSGALWF
ncbi:MAG TPA: aminotransferase class I/II-fold pyridoxal phosphate-dependent enzyme, partial [Planctomycetota bacterium]|nr:aminotransferase class I/II-fold pyridoxal phosphate-dependent enzyme [Planctomycetota bacterium]